MSMGEFVTLRQDMYYYYSSPRTMIKTPSVSKQVPTMINPVASEIMGGSPGDWCTGYALT